MHRLNELWVLGRIIQDGPEFPHTTANHRLAEGVRIHGAIHTKISQKFSSFFMTSHPVRSIFIYSNGSYRILLCALYRVL